MHLSDNGLKFVLSHEGKHEAIGKGRYRAYRCIVGKDKKGRPIYDGKWTIYAGLTEGITEGMIVTEAQGEAMFRKELMKHEAAVNDLVTVDVSQPAYDALCSFSYNCGVGALSKSTLLKKLNQGDTQGAAHEFSKWVNSNGVKNVPGLVRRRAEEKAMFLTPDEVHAMPSMPQAVDAPAPVTTAVQSSRTVFGILTAAGASLVGWFKDAVEQIALFEPAKQIGSGLGVNLTTIVFGITIAGLALALFARLDDAHNGKVVK